MCCCGRKGRVSASSRFGVIVTVIATSFAPCAELKSRARFPPFRARRRVACVVPAARPLSRAWTLISRTVFRDKSGRLRRIKLRRLCREGRKTILKIGDEVANILKPDVEANGRTARRPSRCRAERCAVEWDRQAFEAAP